MDNNEKDLEYFKNLQYYIVVRKKKGKFILNIPELNLFEEGKSFEKAYEKLEAEKEKYFRKMIKMEAQDEIVEPAYLDRKTIKKILHNLVPFFIKLFVTTLIIVIILAVLDDISSTFKHFKRASRNISRIDIPQTFAQLPKNFSQNLTDEQTVYKVVNALDKYEIAKKEKNLLFSKYKLQIPEKISASNHLNDYPIENAFDSKIATFWHSSEEEANIIVKFNLPTKLQALSLTLRQDTPGGLQSPDDLTIEGSHDNKNWEHIYEASRLVWGQGETKRMFLESNSRDYIYYKFNFKKWGVMKNFISIAEMNLYKIKDVDTAQIPSK